MANPAPAQPPVQGLGPPQFLHTRQLVRLYNDGGVPIAIRNNIPWRHLFHARWILEEISDQARWAHPEAFKATPGEADYPQAWLTPQGLQVAITTFAQFAIPILPRWLPSEVLNMAGVAGLQNNLNFRIREEDPNDAGQWVNITNHQNLGTLYKNIVWKAADLSYSLLNTQTSRQALQLGVPRGSNRNRISPTSESTCRVESPSTSW